MGKAETDIILCAFNIYSVFSCFSPTQIIKQTFRKTVEFAGLVKKGSHTRFFVDNNNDLFAAAPKPFFGDKQGDKLLNCHLSRY